MRSWQIGSLAAMAVAVSAFIAPVLAAQSMPDFSGSYTKISPKSSEIQTLQIRQTESAVEVTVTIGNRKSINTFTLDGTVRPYLNTVGNSGTCAAHWKGKRLVLEVTVVKPPQAGHSTLQVRTRAEWELSGDSKKLTSRDTIDMSEGSLSDTSQVTEIYRRN